MHKLTVFLFDFMFYLYFLNISTWRSKNVLTFEIKKKKQKKKRNEKV